MIQITGNALILQRQDLKLSSINKEAKDITLEDFDSEIKPFNKSFLVRYEEGDNIIILKDDYGFSSPLKK